MLGLTQGLTEFLPISSSGHLVLVPWAAGWSSVLADPSTKKAFDVALHMGTLAAVVVVLWPDVRRLVVALLTSIGRRRVASADARLAWLIVLATIPAAVAGAVFEDFVEREASQPWVIGLTLAVFGLVMLVADRGARGRRGVDDLRWRDAVVVGLAQAAALIPGVSRSGATMTAGIALAQSRETAARFSFLLSIPVIAGAGLYKGVDLLRDGFPEHIGPAAFAIGIGASAASGFAAVSGLLRFLRRGSLVPFVIYRGAAAAAVLLLVVTGIRDATLPG